MLGDGKWNSGDQGSFFKYQYGVLKLLEQINASIVALPGVDYETRTTMYQATAPGPGYSTGDIIVRYDIIDVATSTVVSTIWFNQTTQATIAAPAPANITPYNPPSNVTVSNPFNLQATQLLVLANQTNKTQFSRITDGTDDATVTPAGELNVISTAQPGVDIGDVTVTNLPTVVDTNFGAPTANTLRVAAQLGNGALPVDFNTGAVGAQTLRVALTNDIQSLTSTTVGVTGGVITIPAGATSIGFTTNSTFTGSLGAVAGMAVRNSSTFYGFEAAPGKRLPAMDYEVTAGSVIIDILI